VAKLALAKFIYNNSIHVIISLTLFYLLYDFDLELNTNVEDTVLEGEILVVEERI
jgi:hypothetical protein